MASGGTGEYSGAFCAQAEHAHCSILQPQLLRQPLYNFHNEAELCNSRLLGLLATNAGMPECCYGSASSSVSRHPRTVLLALPQLRSHISAGHKHSGGTSPTSPMHCSLFMYWFSVHVSQPMPGITVPMLVLFQAVGDNSSCKHDTTNTDADFDLNSDVVSTGKGQ